MSHMHIIRQPYFIMTCVADLSF